MSHEHHVRPAGFGCGHGVEHDRGRVSALLLCVTMSTPARSAQMTSCSAAAARKVSAAAQQHLLALRLAAGGQLADGGGLAHAVDADEEDDGRLAAQVQRRVAHPHHVRQNLLHALPCAFHVLDLLRFGAGTELIDRLESGLHPHVSQDHGFLQIIIKFIIQLRKALKNADFFDLIKQSHWVTLLLSQPATPF